MHPKIELKAPKDASGLRFKHLPAFQDDTFQERVKNPDAETMIKFVAKFCQHTESYVGFCDYKELKKFYFHCTGLFEGLKAPPRYLTVNGKEYELVNLKSPSMGWVMDQDQSDFEKDPVRLACMCYIPKGTVYGATRPDGSENLINPISSRHAEFKEHFPLEQFFNLNGFFLKRFVKYTSRYTAKERAKTRAIRLRTKMRGWKQSMLSRKGTSPNGTQ